MLLCKSVRLFLCCTIWDVIPFWQLLTEPIAAWYRAWQNMSLTVYSKILTLFLCIFRLNRRSVVSWMLMFSKKIYFCFCFSCINEAAKSLADCLNHFCCASNSEWIRCFSKSCGTWRYRVVHLRSLSLMALGEILLFLAVKLTGWFVMTFWFWFWFYNNLLQLLKI